MPALLTILAGGTFVLAACWAMGAALLFRVPATPELRLATGATILSAIVFALLTAGLGVWPAVAAGTVALAAVRWVPRPVLAGPARAALPRAESWIAAVLFAGYGLFYFVNALAPELLADGITYHLGLTSEYARTGAFPDRVTFYDMVPQGMEMLFTLAFAIGRHSAAKLVEFGCFVATLPLLVRIARRLGLPDRAALAAAALYMLAPVVAATGTSSYNDAGQVLFALAAFYALTEVRDWRYAALAGLLSGFCYAIKMPGLIVVAAGGGYLMLHRDWRGAAWFAAGAAIAIAPWMLRGFVLAGNPFAPLVNAWFPNPYFHVATDRGLAEGLRSLHGVPWWRVPWELALGGGLSGTYGIWLLALPLAGWTRLGRWCLGIAAVLALPWLANTSARFIMLGVPFAALALAASLAEFGRAATWTAIALEAFLCLPPVLDATEPAYGFRLHEFPLAAALRIESEPSYLAGHLDEYKVVRMLDANTPASARILALLSVATAYTARDVRVTWQSAETDRLLDTLRVAGLYRTDPFYDVTATWPEQRLRAVRIRLQHALAQEWCLHEVELRSNETRLPNTTRWVLNASPNPAEAPFALDLNLATRWRTWEPARGGAYFEIELDSPQPLTGAACSSHTPVFGVAFVFEGKTAAGTWVPLSGSPRVSQRAPEDLRLAAIHAVRRAGYRYLLVPSGSEGNGPLGAAIAGHETEWGLEIAGSAGNITLYRIR